MVPSLSTLHEFDDLAVDQARTFSITEILYIEPEPGPDIAFLRVARRRMALKPRFLDVATTDIGDNVPVFTVGYPARAPKRIIPDQDLMNRMYRGHFDVKRAAPGFTDVSRRGSDPALTAQRSAGRRALLVIDLAEGKGRGPAFRRSLSGNELRGARIASQRLHQQKALEPSVELRGDTHGTAAGRAASRPSAATPQSTSGSAAPGGGAVTVTVPLSITVSLGQPYDLVPRIDVAARTDAVVAGPKDIEAATEAFWRQRPEGVIAARVGFNDDGDRIGDTPFIAASVPGNQLAQVEARGPATFQGFEVRYLPADVAEQIECAAARVGG